MSPESVTNNSKLSPADKVQIALSGDKSLRQLAEEFGVHHSTIDDIRKESEAKLQELFESKKAGRPVEEKVISQEEFKALEAQYLEMRDKCAIAEMSKDFLEIKYKYEKIRNDMTYEELLEEEQDKVRKERNKTKKKRKKRKS